MRAFPFLLSLFFVMLSSCTAESEFDASHQCYFSYNKMYHLDCKLNNCIEPNITNTYCIVTQEVRNGVTSLVISLNDGKAATTEPLRTEEERRQTRILGCNNGLIIGRSAFDNGALHAYDRQCPNCLKESVYKPLQWDNNGQWVKCQRCERSYDLNNSGFVVSGEAGSKLIRYQATYDGTRLFVGNAFR